LRCKTTIRRLLRTDPAPASHSQLNPGDRVWGIKKGTVHAIAQTENPEARHLPLVRLLIDTRAESTEFLVRSGMKVLKARLERTSPQSAVPAMRTKPSAKPAAPAQPGVGVVLGVSESR
jgi:hypothetical protein